MVKDDQSGDKPFYRDKKWNRGLRKEQKKGKNQIGTRIQILEVVKAK